MAPEDVLSAEKHNCGANILQSVCVTTSALTGRDLRAMVVLSGWQAGKDFAARGRTDRRAGADLAAAKASAAARPGAELHDFEPHDPETRPDAVDRVMNWVRSGWRRIRAIDTVKLRRIWAYVVVYVGYPVSDFFQRHYVWLFLIGILFWLWIGGAELIADMTIAALGLTQTFNAPEAHGDYANIRNLLLAFAALLGVPFFFLRTWMAERQTRTSEQGHMTDRIAKAVDALGTDKVVWKRDKEGNAYQATEPNLEVRLGAIYALERISQDSRRDHWQVMEILTAYMRENAKDWPNGAPPEPDLHKEVDLDEWERVMFEFYHRDKPFRYWLDRQPDLRIDLQAILSVLARRSEIKRIEERKLQQQLDLRNVILIKPDFIAAEFVRDLSEIDCNGARFMGANLSKADLEGARLIRINFTGAQFAHANLVGTVFALTSLWGANLNGTDLRGAFLGSSELGGASLWGANLQNGFLTAANFESADLDGAIGLEISVGLEHVRNLDKANLPAGWSVSWNDQRECWDIMTPDGPYIAASERDRDA